MSKNFVKDYLSFTRKERIGIIVLIILIVFIFLLPSLFRPHTSPPTTEEIAAFHSLARSLQENKRDSVIQRVQSVGIAKSVTESYKDNAALFYFDPNLLSVEDWKRLGVKARTALTIKRYVSKGGHFRTADDLSKIYGLREQDLLRLKPYVRIAPSEKKMTDKDSTKRKVDSTSYTRKTWTPTPIDINSADSIVLLGLPGIGAKLASRIIHFRDRLGGFYSIDQVKETYGLSDSTFERIRTVLVLGNKPLVRIDINQADAARLKQHPYFTWPMANALVQYRKEHGRFQKVDDLAGVSAILPDQLKRLIPYLSTY